MSLRDDVRWVCEAADGLLVGWLPSRLPSWSTKEGEKLGWLVLLLWRKFYDASMARSGLEAENHRLKDDVDGLRETNERLTDLLDHQRREAVCVALASEDRPDGYYWIEDDLGEVEVAQWFGGRWWIVGEDLPQTDTIRRVLGRLLRPWGPRP